MANPLAKAAAALKAVNESRKRMAREKAKEMAHIVGGTTALALSVAAGISDQKWGKGSPAKVGPVPVNLLAGAVVLVPAFFTGRQPTLQAASVHGGVQLLGIGVYNLVREHVDAG